MDTNDRAFTAQPEHLVVGARGPEARISGRVAAILNRRAGLDTFRRDIRGRDAELDAALLALHFVANDWRRSTLGTDRGNEPEPAPVSEWVGTRAAATQLQITNRGVVKAINENRLPATKEDGRWRINREDLAHYRESLNR